MLLQLKLLVSCLEWRDVLLAPVRDPLIPRRAMHATGCCRNIVKPIANSDLCKAVQRECFIL
jgi:hypothetical protein